MAGGVAGMIVFGRGLLPVKDNCGFLMNLIAFSRAIAAPNSIGALNATRTQANTILS
jgi:hypothetical protein